MKKVLVLLDIVGMVISVGMWLVTQDKSLLKVFVIFLMGMIYTIWSEQIMRFRVSWEWKYSYDLEPTKLARITAKAVPVILTIGGYFLCVFYPFLK